MNECAILLEARNPSRNILRSYYISAWHDLFDRLMIEVVHGRVGAKGKSSMFFMNHQEEAIEFISELLKRRESAVKRLGVPYLLKYYAGHWDIEEALFPFRQNLLFDNLLPLPEKKQPFIREIIREGEGLFCNEPSPPLRSPNPY
jgi:hypothetical protein